MGDIRLIYIFFHTILFFVFLGSGYFLARSKTKLQYYKIATIPILSFAIVSGLRFGRDIDYNVYYLRYIDNNQYSNYELIFSQIVETFNFFHIPYPIFILFCSTFLIFSFLVLLSKFRDASTLVLPLFLGVMGIENFIRWYLAFSFILIGINYLLERKYITTVILFLISFGIHVGMIILIIFIGTFYLFINKRTLNPVITISLFSFTLFLGSVDYLMATAFILEKFSLPFFHEKINLYLNNAVTITSGGMSTGIYERTLSNNIRYFICYVFPIYFGTKTFLPLLKEKGLIWLYNLTIFSIIVFPLFRLVEIFNRISSSLMCISIILIATFIYLEIKKKSLKNISVALLLISFFALAYPIIKIPFTKDEKSQMMYIWDADGRNYIPF